MVGLEHSLSNPHILRAKHTISTENMDKNEDVKRLLRERSIVIHGIKGTALLIIAVLFELGKCQPVLSSDLGAV